MKSSAKLYTLLAAIVLCSSCHAGTVVSTSETGQESASSKPADNSESISPAESYAPEDPPQVDVLFDFDLVYDASKTSWAYISFDSDSAEANHYDLPKGESDLTPVSYQNDCILCTDAGIGFGMFGTYDLSTGIYYFSEYWASDHVDFFPNGVIAVVGYSQDFRVTPHMNSERPVLMDQYCRPLSYQLQFDYGENLDENRELYKTDFSLIGDRYRVIGLVYNQEKRQYVAVYNTNAFWGGQDGNYDNSTCEMGVAIFDESGKQLDRFSLPGAVFSHMDNWGRHFPETFLIGETELLMVPQYGYRDPSGTYVEGETYYINLESREWASWSQEETQAFFDSSTLFEGSYEIYGGWSIQEVAPSPPFTIETDPATGYMLLYLPDVETPVFRIPAHRKLYLWGQEADGRYYAVFIYDSSM